MSKKLEAEIEGLLAPLLTNPYELVDVEYVKEGAFYYLRIFIDKEGGLGIDDISNITSGINKILDEKDPIKEQYFLEVSSPGLDRILKKERDFQREKGKEVELKLYRPRDGQKQFEGILEGLDEQGNVLISMEQEVQVFDKKDIAQIRLKVNF